MRVKVWWGKVRGKSRDEGWVLQKIGVVGKELNKFSEGLKKMEVGVVKKQRWGYGVKMSLLLPGKSLFAEAKSKRWQVALIEAREKLVRQVKEYVAKLRRRG